jgi:hypothetical protein
MEEQELSAVPVGIGTDDERKEVLDALIAKDDRWKFPDTPLEDPRWVPDLIRDDGSAVLHHQAGGNLLPFMVRRLKRVSELGIEVHMSCSLAALYDERLLRSLSSVHPVIHLQEEGGVKPEPLLLTVALQGIQLSRETRQQLAEDGLSRSSVDGTSHQKGRRFEAVVAFLFSQVDGFRVSATNYRTDTEEIDVVVRQLAADGRIWARDGPLILIEAKNHAAGISQDMFSAFRTKLEVKRGRVKLGFMVSRTTVSGEAERQEAKTAMGDIAIVFLDGENLASWIPADDPDEWLEGQVEAAVLD